MKKTQTEKAVEWMQANKEKYETVVVCPPGCVPSYINGYKCYGKVAKQVINILGLLPVPGIRTEFKLGPGTKVFVFPDRVHLYNKEPNRHAQ